MSMVPAASGYPSNLAFLARRLSGFSRQTIRLLPINMTSASATSSSGTPVSVMLPSNAILDLDTLSMFFQGSTTTSAGTACFPKNIETVVRNLNLMCGDRTIDNILEYGKLWNDIMDHTSGTDSEIKRSVMNNGGTVVKSKIIGGTIANETGVRYAINSWLGFIGSCRPRMVDSSLMNPLKLTLELAPSQILVQSTSATNPQYSLSDIFFTIDIVNVLDGVLSATYYKMLSSSPDAYLEFPYSRWSMFSSVGGTSGTTIFNNSSQSLDMVVSFFNPTTSAANQFTDSNGLNTSAIAGTSTYFMRPSSFRNSNGSVAFELKDWQYQIGGRQLPAWPVTNDLTYALNMDTIKANRDLLGGVTNTLDGTTALLAPTTSAYGYGVTPMNQNYMTAYSTFLIRLNNDEEPGWISGLNTSGNTLYSQFTWNGTGTVNGGQLQNLVYTKCTSSFIVKYGRQAEVIW